MKMDIMEKIHLPYVIFRLISPTYLDMNYTQIKNL